MPPGAGGFQQEWLRSTSASKAGGVLGSSVDCSKDCMSAGLEKKILGEIITKDLGMSEK